MKIITLGNIKFRVIPIIINDGIYIINENDDLTNEEMSSDTVYLFNDMTDEEAKLFVEKVEVSLDNTAFKSYGVNTSLYFMNAKESLKSLLIDNSINIKAWIKDKYYPSQQESEQTHGHADESYADMLQKASDDLLLIKY
jgi:hypothetical protein